MGQEGEKKTQNLTKKTPQDQKNPPKAVFPQKYFTFICLTIKKHFVGLNRPETFRIGPMEK